MKLASYKRDEIKREVMQNKYSPEEKKLNTILHAFGLRIVEIMVDKKYKKAWNSLPDKYKRSTKLLYVFSGVSLSGDYLTIRFDKAQYVPNYLTDSWDTKFGLGKSHPLHSEWLQLYRKVEKLSKWEKELRLEVKAILQASSKDKQLLKNWPDVVKYAPKAIKQLAINATPLVPNMDKLNNLLNQQCQQKLKVV